MLNFSFILLTTLICAQAQAQINNSTRALNASVSNSVWDRFGASYLSFFDGPGLGANQSEFTPNTLGRPAEDGLALTNNISIRYMIKEDFNFDMQIRAQWVTNNANQVDDFESFRWQSPRFGISTTYFKTKNSKLTGAINTDLPYYFPEPIGGGYIAKKRTTVLTPGMFAKYTYAPTTSRWSVMSLVMPRYFYYRDRTVAEEQLSRAGYSPKLKNEFFITLSPTVNYAFTDKFGARLGSEFVYKKLVLSDWNPFRGSTNSADTNSKAWRLAPIPLQAGLTYDFHKSFSLSSFIQGFPIAGMRRDKQGNKTDFEDTLSIGAWISGIIF